MSILLSGSCGGSGNDEDGTVHGAVICDPLEGPASEPIELGNVLAAGKAADGTLYVLDEVESGELRIFVSQNGTLYRQVVDGSGTGTDNGESWYSVRVDDGGAGFALFVRIDASGNVLMGVVDGATDARGPDIPPEALVLETLSADSLDMPVQNLPSGQEIEYLAEVDTGETLLVVRPTFDWDYEDFRVFYGMPEDVLEREVTSVQRARDGGSTHVIFRLPSGSVDAFFPVVFDGMNFIPGGATLTLAGTEHALERLSPDPSALDDLTIRCLQ